MSSQEGGREYSGGVGVFEFSSFSRFLLSFSIEIKEKNKKTSIAFRINGKTMKRERLYRRKKKNQPAIS